MEFWDGVELINYAKEQAKEEKLHNTWLHGYNQETDFEEFKAMHLTVSVNDTATAEETLNKVKSILDNFKV